MHRGASNEKHKLNMHLQHRLDVQNASFGDGVQSKRELRDQCQYGGWTAGPWHSDSRPRTMVRAAAYAALARPGAQEQQSLKRIAADL